MRIRSIKPDFWTNEKLSALPPETHILAAALLNYADDEGYFNANPKLINGALFPIRDVSGNLPVMLQSLSTAGGIGFLEVRISTDGRAYGWIINFKVHQVVNKPRASAIKSLFEACSRPDGAKTVALPDAYRTPTGGNGMEGNGNGREQGMDIPRQERGAGEVEISEEAIRQRMMQVNQLTNRVPSVKWSKKEVNAFKAAGLDKCSADEFAEQIAPMLTYYAATLVELRPFWGTHGAEDFRRRDLATILSNWAGELDRATKYCEHARKKADEENKGRL